MVLSCSRPAARSACNQPMEKIHQHSEPNIALDSCHDELSGFHENVGDGGRKDQTLMRSGLGIERTSVRPSPANKHQTLPRKSLIVSKQKIDPTACGIPTFNSVTQSIHERMDDTLL